MTMNNVAAPATNSKRPYWKIYQDQFTGLGDLPALLLLDELTYRCRAGRWQIDYPVLSRRLCCRERWLRVLFRQLSDNGLIATGSTHYGRGIGSRAWVDIRPDNASALQYRSNSTLLRHDRAGVFRQPIHTEEDRQTTVGGAETKHCVSGQRARRSKRVETCPLRDGDPDLVLLGKLRLRIDDDQLYQVTSWSDPDREHMHRALSFGINLLAVESQFVHQLRQRLTDKHGVDPSRTFAVLKTIVLRLFQSVRENDPVAVLTDQRELLTSWRRNRWGASLHQLVNLRFGQRVFDRAAQSVTAKKEVAQEACA